MNQGAKAERGLRALRQPVYRILDPITGWFVRRGVHPNLITTVGFLVTMGAGLSYHLERVRLAGFLVLLGGVFDIFDGRVARESGLASKFGSFYDSTLDRISEIAVFLGLTSLYAQGAAGEANTRMIYVVLLALGGSLMVSYTRARAEGLGLDCSVGLMQRAERVVLLGFGSLIFGLSWQGLVLNLVLAVVAATTVLTAVQRIVWVYRQAAGVPLEAPVVPQRTTVAGKGKRKGNHGKA